MVTDVCGGVDCEDVPLPQAVAVLEPMARDGRCVCVPTECVDGYVLMGGVCLYDEEGCGPGYDDSCDPEEYVSCYDAPQVSFCRPTRCAEQPVARDGTDLVALGKCVDAPPPPGEGCTNACHDGIEDAHPWFGGPELTCTGCHGGNPEATIREEAHVPLPPIWQENSPTLGRPSLRYYYNYLTLTGVERVFGGHEWLRFRSPGDLRIADQTCGKSAGCHMDRVANMRRSVMATAAGVLGSAEARSGIGRSVIRDGDDVYKWDSTSGMIQGAAELQARIYRPGVVGLVSRITAFETEDRENTGYDPVDVLREIYDKSCGGCHAGTAGRNDRFGDFRSSGCSACHSIYRPDGRSRSQDPTMDQEEPTYPAAFERIANLDSNDLGNLYGAWLGPERPHPAVHAVTTYAGSKRCGTCHSGSNHTVFQYRGLQVDPNRSAVTALNQGVLRADQLQLTPDIDNDREPMARYHGLAEEQVLRFVDWNDDGFDDIPADIHYQAGLECIDCHTSAEMHNELRRPKVPQVTDWSDPEQVDDLAGALWSHMDQATEVECVHCHGNLEHRALPFEADNRNPIRNLIACPELRETIPDYTPAAECQQLGRGRWLFGKLTGRWHYVPQTYDTVNDAGVGTGAGATFPNGAPVYTLNASIFHGRVDQDSTNGVGPCRGGDARECFRDQPNRQGPITDGFSHLGQPAASPVDQMGGGLECYACHATWANMCFGCHLRLADTNGDILLRDFSRATGELTLGMVVEEDVTAVSPLDLQYGINAEGKIAQLLPESKQQVAHTDQLGSEYFGTQVVVNDDASIQYNLYRHRSGYGLRQYETELVGLPPNADGPSFDQVAQMDANAGQGAQPMMPHTIQRSHPLMDCTSCHINPDLSNTDAVAARFMLNPQGFGNVSAYLDVLANTGIRRKDSNRTYSVDPTAGYRFDANTDPTAFVVDQQSDWCVDQTTGFPYCYGNHPMRHGSLGITVPQRYQRAFPGDHVVQARTAGPLNLELIEELYQVVVEDEGVEYRGVR